MAQEFKLPGLDKIITDLDRMHEKVKANAKDLLDMAVAFEKATPKGKGAENLKPLVEETKKAKIEADKLEIATKKLKDSQTEEAKQLALVTFQIQKQNAENKNWAKGTNENATALEKFNFKISESTKASKELGAQMALLELEGKKNTKEYKDLEKSFANASATSKKLNDSYRDISKTAGDNRALVGSYSDELKGHFEGINANLTSLKGNIASGNISGVFNDARNTVKGFGEYLNSSKDKAKELGKDVTTGKFFTDIKSKATDAGKATLSFFKPADQHSAQMRSGLERVMIGFRRNNDSLSVLNNTQNQSNSIQTESNATTNKGSLATQALARGKLILAGATQVAAGGFRVLSVAIIATGIGAIIIAIVAGVALLINGLSKLDSVTDGLQQIFAGFGAGLSKASAIVTDFIKTITSFKDALSKIGNFFSDPIGAIKSFANEVGNAAAEAAKLKAQEQDLEDLTGIYETRQKKIENEIALNKTKLRDTKLSLEERAKLEKKVEDDYVKLTTMRNELNDKNAKQTIDLAINSRLTKQGINKQTLQDEINNGELVYATYLLNADRIDKETFDRIKSTVNARLDANNKAVEDESRTMDKIEKQNEKAQARAEKAQKDEIDRQKKLAEMAISTMKITLDNEIATYDQSRNLANNNLAHIEAVSQMKLQIASAEMRKELIGIQKGSLEEREIRLKNSQEIQKIKIEKNNAIADAQKESAKFEIELYDTNTQILLDQQKDLTDQLIDEQKNRIAQSLELHKKAMREELGIDEDTTDEKLRLYEKTNAKLSANEMKYLGYIKTAEIKAEKDSEKLDDNNLNRKLKQNDTEAKNEVKKFNLSGKAQIKNNVNELKEEEKKLKKDRSLYAENSKEVKEIDDKLAENKQKLEKIKSDATKQSLQTGLDNLINIAGQESDIGKAAAIAKVTMATIEGVQNAYTTAQESPITVFFPGYPVLQAGLAGVFGATQIAKIVGVDMFEKGTMNAPYTGKAIVDEAGAEIHTDAFGNIKSFGSNDGARFTDIIKGDKIIPADVSAVIRKSMFASYGMNQNQIDYALLGNEFGKHAKEIVKAIQSKPETNFNFDNGKFNLHVKQGHTVMKNLNTRVTFKGKTNA